MLKYRNAQYLSAFKFNEFLCPQHRELIKLLMAKSSRPLESRLAWFLGRAACGFIIGSKRVGWMGEGLSGHKAESKSVRRIWLWLKCFLEDIWSRLGL